MYVRTDRVRELMQRANQAACNLNHEYVGTEHLLLGMVQDKFSNAGIALTFLIGNRMSEVITAEVNKLVKTGPNLVTMGKLPLTQRSKAIYEYAAEEARGLDSCAIGTDHILLGMLRESDGVAGAVLGHFNVTLENARKALVSSNDETTIETIAECRAQLQQSPDSPKVTRPSTNELTFRDPRNVRIWQQKIMAAVVGYGELGADISFNFTEEGLIIDVIKSDGDGSVLGTSSETYEELIARLTGDVAVPKPEGRPGLVMLGNLSEGYKVVGPFKDWEAAAAWSEGREQDSWITHAEDPDDAKFKQS